MNKKTVAVITGVMLLLVISIGVSFAYFTATLSGGETATTITVGGGTLNITYSSGSNINITNVFPGNSPIATKAFTLTGNNTTDLTMPYTINLVVDENGFMTNSISYKLDSTNTDSSGIIAPAITTNVNLNTGSGTYQIGSGEFVTGTGKKHDYVLKLYFLDNPSVDQNNDQGKTFKAHITIIGEEANYLPTYCDINDCSYLQHAIIGLAEDSDVTSVYNEPATDYRYEGLNVNNYVRFNNELWRIIGIFSDNTHLQSGEHLVKIIRATSIGDIKWDTSYNNWETSTLNQYLNGAYYNTVNSESQSLIKEVTWKLGGWDTDNITSSSIYGYERGTTVYTGRPIQTLGKIGLMYPSDYGYSAHESTCARTTILYNYNYNGCFNQTWLFLDSHEWTLTPRAGYQFDSWIVSGWGNSSYNTVYGELSVRPSLYLKSNTKLLSGDGSSGNPYIIGS